MADVSQPILGADFLERFGILIDVKKIRRIIDGSFPSKSRCTIVCEPPLRLTLLSCDDKYRNLLSKFQKIAAPGLKRPSGNSPVTQCILTKGPPVASKARRLSPGKIRSHQKGVFVSDCSGYM
ncbi:transposon Tf2-6 polyprotein [Trichonephila clavata]|uniref:Transposon Tf2-6 polyprotein n=1 Tax=Trichonephila clavata TaxID=2740835 RepID=A0A8X6KLB9_TRICU|nr:transposon Tf2-6 polyprotein [Trichonephila clavata]